MATDRELAAQSMMQAGIGSLGGRPDTTYRDKLNQITANAQAAQMGNWNWKHTPSQIRQDAINWGQKAGLPNRISFAGESGRDILNPNEMRVNAPSYRDWKSMAQRKMIMDRRYQGEDNPYYEIPAANQGYKVMNAASPFDFSADDNWLRQFGQYMKRYLPGYDPEADEYRQKKYRELMNQLEGKADPLEGALQGGMMGLPHESNPWLADEYNEDSLEQEKMNKWIEDNNIGPEDLGMEQLPLEASGDSYNIMAGELIRSGLFDPVEIQNMDSYELQQNYENTFGSESDAMQMSLNLQDVIDLHKLQGLPLNTDRFMKRANKANVQVTNRGGIIGLI